MHMITLTSSTVSLLLFLVVLLALGWRKYSAPPLPPGPPGLPIIGQLLTFSPARQHELFREWAERYGDLFHFRVLHQPIIVISSQSVAAELMEKRGANYSNRPACVTFEMMGYEYDMVLMQYGPIWRKHRKLFQECLSSRVTKNFLEIQTREAHALLKRLLADPAKYRFALETFSMRTITEIAYGHRIRSDEDPYAKTIHDAAEGLMAATTGVSPLDFFPFLRHLPDWVPGIAALSAVPQKWRPITRRMIEAPFREVRKQMISGTAPPSFCSYHLEHLQEKIEESAPEELKHIEGAASIVLIGGLETTWTVLQIFMLCMVLFPDAQRKAQKELDSVIGQDRLPAFADRDNLPFVESLVQEVLRWHPPVPLGVPHYTAADDIYNDALIPARTLVIPNIKAMSRDARVYHEPEAFCPERFLPQPEGRGEPHFEPAWGFGRRICPGRHLASNSLWIAAATVLAAFSIGKATGADGKPVQPLVEFATGAQTSPPKPFRCDIQPRSKRAVELISQLSD